MTRETKIGLLVGLAFIVVFAMLLSHSAPTPPPGDALQFAALDHGASPEVMSNGPAGLAINSDPSSTNPMAGSATLESPAAVAVEAPLAGEAVAELPNPAALEPSVVDVPGEPAAAVADVTAELVAPPTTDVLEMTRVAPALPEPIAPPEPTVRESAPGQSPPPDEPANVVPPTSPNTPPKEYIVKKGDNLGQIAKSLYGTSAVRVVEFLVKANKERIKNKNVVAEGQKLVVPQLPPDMFEPAPGFSVTQVGATKAMEMDELINRRAPITPKPDSTGKPAEPIAAKSTKETRVYEVQPKDTFSSIAREQLGSETYWREIQKLNKGVDPGKMRPGTKIKLPVRRPLTAATTAGRSSA